ncbi:hypothetical protein JCM10207_001974 [Rhodosporidiobolus poonsookiae]
MPPDRHSTPSSSSTTLDPLSSSNGINRGQALGRGKACRQCRKRKVRCVRFFRLILPSSPDSLSSRRCDGRTPICTPCSASKRNGSSSVACDYDTEEERKKPVGGGKVSALEAKIAALEERIAELTSTPNPPLAPAAAPYGDSSSFSTAPSPLPKPPSASSRQLTPLSSVLAHPAGAGSTTSSSSTLPPYPVLCRLIDTFFTSRHECVDIVNRRRFMLRFELPPDHPDYPAATLLHSMAAISIDLLGEEVAFEGYERYWGPDTSASEYHVDQAAALLPDAYRTESSHIQIAQAALFIAWLNITHGRFSRFYIDIGISIRISISMGLNYSGPVRQHLPLTAVLADRTMLPFTTDVEELQERNIVVWGVFSCETITCAAQGLPGSIDERDFTAFLPAATPYDLNDPLARDALYLHSPNFFTTNPSALVRQPQMNWKALVLMNRVVSFVHRAISLACAEPERGALEPVDFPKVRASPAFQRLEASLDYFCRRIPSQLNILLDPEAFIFPAVIGASVIVLHENFVGEDEACPSRNACLKAADDMMKSLRGLSNAAVHTRPFSPFEAYAYLVCGRVYIRELMVKREHGTLTADDTSRVNNNIQAIVAALRNSRTGVGPQCASALLVLLDNPTICLPRTDDNGRVIGPPPVSQMMQAMASRPELTAFALSR